MRTPVLLAVLLALPGIGLPACRDCAEGALGGPPDNSFTLFDAACATAGCREPGMPEILVNTATLNLYLRVVDLPFGGDAGFGLVRSFNLDDNRGGPFGRGWSFNLGETLVVSDDRQTCTLRRGSGRVDVFAAAAQSGAYFAVTRTTDALRQNSDGTWRLSNPLGTESRTFLADGRLSSIDGGSFRRVSLEYDGSGRLARARSQGRRIEFAYDDAGRITTVSDSAGRSVSYAYTADGLLASQVNADGGTFAYGYDDSGRLAAIAGAGGAFALQYNGDPDYTGIASIGVPDGTARAYDTPQPRQVRVTDGSGNAVTYAYTASGWIESVTDGAGNRTAYAYDIAGRRIRATNPAGEASRFDYDAAGNLAAIVDSAGSRWTAAYDATGRPLRLVDANGNAWQFRYDANGDLAVVTDPAGGQTTATRNAQGMVASITGPNGNRSLFQYDADGLPAQFTDALGGLWRWEFDGAARVAASIDPGGSRLAADYDARNRLAGVTAAGSRVDFGARVERDGLGRPASWTDSFGNALQYAYDAAGRLAGLTFAAGSITYEYDPAGRLAKVADWLGNAALYRYDNAGSVASVNIAGGPLTVYQYDAARRLSAVISTGADGTLVAAYRYTRDDNGNRTTVKALEPLTAPWSPAAASIAYDGLNRVVSRDDGRAYRYDAGGRLVAVDGPLPAALAYDAIGRLAAFTAGDSATASSYDAAGLRVERNRDGGVRRYLYDLSGARPRPVMETDGANRPVAWYVYGLGLLWKIDAAGRAWFYHFDGAGNVAAVSGGDGAVADRYRYDPLGTLVTADEAVENPFRARGEAGWVDDGNGLLYAPGAFYWPEARAVLPAAPGLDPPDRALMPSWRGPAACFFEGVAACGFAAGRSTR